MYLLKYGKYPERKEKLDSVASMTGEEFHQYLESKLVTITVPTTRKNVGEDQTATTTRNNSGEDQTPLNMTGWAVSLNEEYLNLQDLDSKPFLAHVKFGKRLIIAKRKFDSENKKKKETWNLWIKAWTSIKEACDRNHRAVAKLIAIYPKLEKLQNISYSHFLQIKPKIEQVFAENVSIGEQWKE
jgi:hypothetical protein